MVLAPAHLDAGGAAAAVPAVDRRHPRLADPADQHRPRQGRRLQGRPPLARGHLRQARDVPRLQLGVVLRDLPAALHLPHRLHRAPHLAVRRPAPQPPAGRAAPPDPAARVRDVAYGGGAGGGPRGGAAAAEEAAVPRPPGRYGGGVREGVPAGAGQPRLPRRADRDAGGVRRRQPVEVRGRQARHRGRRLRQQPHAVRRLHVRPVLRPGRDGAVRLHPRQLRRDVRAHRAGARYAAHLPRQRHVLHRRRRHGTPHQDRGQRAAGHRRVAGLPPQPRLRAAGEGQGRPRQGRLRRRGAVPDAGPEELHLHRRGEGAQCADQGRQAQSAGLPGLLRADLRRQGLRLDVLDVPGARLPGADAHRVPR